jgi:hypothetical protein
MEQLVVICLVPRCGDVCEVCAHADRKQVPAPAQLASLTHDSNIKAALRARPQEWIELAWSDSDEKFRELVSEINSERLNTPGTLLPQQGTCAHLTQGPLHTGCAPFGFARRSSPAVPNARGHIQHGRTGSCSVTMAPQMHTNVSRSYPAATASRSFPARRMVRPQSGQGGGWLAKERRRSGGIDDIRLTCGAEGQAFCWPQHARRPLGLQRLERARAFRVRVVRDDA